MTRLLLLLVMACSATAGDTAAVLEQWNAAQAATAKFFGTGPASWAITQRQGLADPVIIEVSSRTAKDWRQIHAVRRQGKQVAEVRSLGETTWIKVGTNVVEVTDVAMRHCVAAIEGTAWLLPRAFDPAVTTVEAGTWRGKPVTIFTGTATAGHQGPVRGIRWICAKEDQCVVQVDRYDAQGEMLWTTQVTRRERLTKIDDTLFSPMDDKQAKRGLKRADVTLELLAACER